VVRLVDQLLNSKAGGIGGATVQERSGDRECYRRTKTRHTDPNQRAREVIVLALVFVRIGQRITPLRVRLATWDSP